MSKQNKFILWCVLVAVTSFWTWAVARIWLSGSLFDQANLVYFGIFGALIILLMALLSMGFIFFSGKKYGLILSAIVGFMYFLLFGITNLNLIGVTILILLFIHSDDIVSGEMMERIKINSRALIRKGLPNMVLALFILVSFAAYQSPAIESFKDIQELPSASGAFVKKVAEQTLSGQLEEANPQQKEIILNQVTEEITREFNLFLKPYFEYVPPALAFGLFLVLWGIGWIFIYLSLYLGVLIFFMMKKVKFIKIEERDVKAETLIV